MAESSVEILSINCPKCGAPYGGEGGCGYCGSEIIMQPKGAIAKPIETGETKAAVAPLEAHQSWIGKKFQETDTFLQEIAGTKELKLAVGGIWSLTAGTQALMGDWPRWVKDAGRVIESIQSRGINVNQVIDIGKEILKFTLENPHEAAAIAAATAATLYFTAFTLQGVGEVLSEE